MDKKDLISITEYARLRGVTTETLRHYDRIDLLKPYYTDPNSGLRYYSLMFSDEKLGTIMELKELGMSLGDIKVFLKGRNLKKSLETLKKLQGNISETIRELTNRNEVLCERIKNIERYLKDEYEFDTVIVKYIGSREAIISDAKYLPEEEIDINREAIIMENHMTDMAPLIGGERFALIAPIEDLLDGDPRFYVSLIVEDIHHDNSSVSMIPGGEYACIYRYGDAMDVMKTFETIEEFCDREGYIMDGNAVELLVVDMSITDIPEENIYEMQVPVRKKP